MRSWMRFLNRNPLDHPPAAIEYTSRGFAVKAGIQPYGGLPDRACLRLDRDRARPGQPIEPPG